MLTEDLTGHLTDGLPLELGGDYTSRDDMMTRGWGRVGKSFDMRPEPEELHAVSNELLVARGYYVGSSVEEGQPVRAAFAHFWGTRDGRFSSVHQVTDSAAWEHALQ